MVIASETSSVLMRLCMDEAFHALWTDSNNRQTVVWFYGAQFVPTPINQEDIATASGSF
jgi:hypothetical protein